MSNGLFKSTIFGSLFVMGSISARADETDAFTNRAPLPDALPALDGILAQWVSESIAAANKAKPSPACAPDALRAELRSRINGFHINPKSIQGRSHLEAWASGNRAIARNHVKFKDSVYSDKAYNSVILYPVNHYIMQLADSITLGGHYIGLDKINHFIREGLRYYDTSVQAAAAAPGLPRAEVMTDSLIRTVQLGTQLEKGIQGLRTTGVFSYADLAANYAGYWFWLDLLELDRAESYIECDPAANQFKLRPSRSLTLANYVNDSWDEGVNCSDYAEKIRQSVNKVLQARSQSCPVDIEACRRLGSLPNAAIYVNPMCLGPNQAAASKPAAGGGAGSPRPASVGPATAAKPEK